ncbi:ATP-binding protein [uncultured Parasutterella sp.]|uniref:ATP-binding protein n=1 Tax=uncultured Parasutterella sp. TaxID=1263098 RepID=UPI0025F5AFF4|nr:ATP-binding protein [uncultured Parasutterella sp.]
MRAEWTITGLTYDKEKAGRTFDSNNRQVICQVLSPAQCDGFNCFMASEVNLSMEGPLIWEKSPRSFVDAEEKEAPQGRNERSIVASALSGSEVLEILNTEAYFRLSRMEIADNKEDQLRYLEKLDLIKKSGSTYEIPLFSAYLLARNLSDFDRLAGKRVRIVSYGGNDNLSPAICDIEFKEGIVEAFPSVFKEVVRLIPRHEKIDSESGRRLIEFSIPQAVIREALSNAFAHQDLFSEGDGVVIEIFNNRVEITNSGRPVLDSLHFLDGGPAIKNEKIFAEMKNLGLVDGQGYGWRKIVKELESRSLPAPEIKIRENSLTVTLWFDKPLKFLSLDQRNWTVYLHTVLRYLLSEPANNASLRQRLNLPESKSSTVSKWFRQAAEGGLLKPFDKHSSNKTKRYVPAWCQDSSQISRNSKDFEKQKLEEEKAKNTQNPSSNKVFIDDEDEQLIQKARQRLKELGSIKVRIEDL